jgi:hypothetical protein
MVSRTLAELAKEPVVNAGELVAVLKDYAEGGWVIQGNVVIDIIRRTPLNTAELAKILAYLRTGEDKQWKVCSSAKLKFLNSEEYKKVLLYIAERSLID